MNVGKPITTPASAPANPAITMPNQGLRPSFTSRSATVYAPMPKKAAWPNDISPEYPEKRFQATPTVAQIGTSVNISW